MRVEIRKLKPFELFGWRGTSCIMLSIAEQRGVVDGPNESWDIEPGFVAILYRRPLDHVWDCDALGPNTQVYRLDNP